MKSYTRSFITIVILHLFFDYSISIQKINEQNPLCANIAISGSELRQLSFSINHNEQILVFRELISENEKDDRIGNFSSLSFQIQNNCTLITNTGNYMSGDSTGFTTDTTLSLDSNQVNSLACYCKQDCQCEDIKIKSRNDCGRAYIWNDCSYCNSFYTNLKHGENIPFPSSISDKVSSIIVKTGCHLTVVNNNATTNISGDSFIERFLGPLNSYSCKCDSIPADKIGKSSILENNESSFIEMPSNRASIRLKLSRPEYKNHPGLMAGLESLRGNRSPKNAYMLLLGMTGSGKSSTVNFLFDNPTLTQVGNSSSTTTNINEFQISISIPELKLKNSALKIIDTPGISDTRGITQDAQFLATFDDYLKKHSELKTYKPNIILIVCDFNDNRYAGENSGFVKMLRIIELFRDRIIDDDYTNVIFMFTHFMSETMAITRNPTHKLQSIEKVIQEYSTLPNPILMVVGENKPESHGLLQLNDFYHLPNGELYPQNLFIKIQQSLTRRSDPIGNAIIQTVFQNPQAHPIKIKSTKLFSKTHSKVTHYLQLLGRIELAIENTEISNLLNDTYNNPMEVSSSLKNQFPNTLHSLKRACYQNGILNVEDIPKISSRVKSLLQKIHLNPLSELLLTQTLNITIPTFEGNLPVGQSYYLFEDKISNFPSILTPTAKEVTYYSSQIGYQIPSYLDIQPLNQVTPIFKILEDMSSYAIQRWTELDTNILDENLYKISNQFTGTLKRGYNVFNNLTFEPLTAQIEFSRFHLQQNQDFQLSDNYIQALRDLHPFNSTDWKTVEDWTHFFSKFGTYVVTGGTMGGSILFEVKSRNPFENGISQIEKFNKLSETMEHVVAYVVDSLVGQNTQDLQSIENDTETDYTIVLKGGNLHNTEYKNLSHLDDQLYQWENTLNQSPIFLDTYFNIEPISKLLLQKYVIVDSNDLLEKLKEGEKNYLNASLVHIPLSPIPQLTKSNRENSGKPQEMSQGNYDSLSKFVELFKEMNENSVKMQEDYIQMMKTARNQAEESEKSILDVQGEYQKQREERKRQNELEEEDFNDQIKIERQSLARQERLDAANLEAEFSLKKQQIETDKYNSIKAIEEESQASWMNFILTENSRKTQDAMSKKDWLETTLGTLQNKAEEYKGKIMSMLPMIMAAG